MNIKTHKYGILAGVSYVTAILVACIPLPYPETPSYVYHITNPTIMMAILAGIVFSLKSKWAKESSWAADVLLVLGLMILVAIHFINVFVSSL